MSKHHHKHCREDMDPCGGRRMGSMPGMSPVMPMQAITPMSGMCVMTPRGPVCHIMPADMMRDMNRMC